MTIEEIVECDADTLEKMSDEELLKHFQKYLTVTRPELAVKPSTKKSTEPAIYISPQKQEALRLLAESGVDISFIKRKKK